MNECKVCNKTFKSQKWLDKHRRRKGGCKTQKCESCKLSIAGPRHLHECKNGVKKLTYRAIKRICSQLTPLAFNRLAQKLGYSVPEIILMHTDDSKISPPEKLMHSLVLERPDYDILKLAQIFKDTQNSRVLKGKIIQILLVSAY